MCASRSVIQVAVLTVSDRCAAGVADDTAGPAVADLLVQRLDARVSWTGVVPDERKAIAVTLKNLADRDFDLLVTVGGTGCGPRDVTPEATRDVIAREVPGLAEAMRTASARVTPHALLQRGLCGACGSALIVNLPGSRKAAVENLTVILPAIPHAVRLIWGADHRFLLPLSILTGAIFMILTDLISRTVLAPTEIPIGVITAICGAPFFLYLLRKRKKAIF